MIKFIGQLPKLQWCTKIVGAQTSILELGVFVEHILEFNNSFVGLILQPTNLVLRCAVSPLKHSR